MSGDPEAADDYGDEDFEDHVDIEEGGHDETQELGTFGSKATATGTSATAPAPLSPTADDPPAELQPGGGEPPAEQQPGGGPREELCTPVAEEACVDLPVAADACPEPAEIQSPSGGPEEPATALTVPAAASPAPPPPPPVPAPPPPAVPEAPPAVPPPVERPPTAPPPAYPAAAAGDPLPEARERTGRPSTAPSAREGSVPYREGTDEGYYHHGGEDNIPSPTPQSGVQLPRQEPAPGHPAPDSAMAAEDEAGEAEEGPQSKYCGVLYLRVEGCRGLPHLQSGKKPSAYCLVSFLGHHAQSQVDFSTCTPQWNQAFHFIGIERRSGTVNITVLSAQTPGSSATQPTNLGSVTLHVGGHIDNDCGARWLPLRGTGALGKVQVRWKYDWRLVNECTLRLCVREGRNVGGNCMRPVQGRCSFDPVVKVVYGKGRGMQSTPVARRRLQAPEAKKSKQQGEDDKGRDSAPMWWYTSEIELESDSAQVYLSVWDAATWELPYRDDSSFPGRDLGNVGCVGEFTIDFGSRQCMTETPGEGWVRLRQPGTAALAAQAAEVAYLRTVAQEASVLALDAFCFAERTFGESGDPKAVHKLMIKKVRALRTAMLRTDLAHAASRRFMFALRHLVAKTELMERAGRCDAVPDWLLHFAASLAHTDGQSHLQTVRRSASPSSAAPAGSRAGSPPPQSRRSCRSSPHNSPAETLAADLLGGLLSGVLLLSCRSRDSPSQPSERPTTAQLEALNKLDDFLTRHRCTDWEGGWTNAYGTATVVSRVLQLLKLVSSNVVAQGQRPGGSQLAHLWTDPNNVSEADPSVLDRIMSFAPTAGLAVGGLTTESCAVAALHIAHLPADLTTPDSCVAGIDLAPKIHALGPNNFILPGDCRTVLRFRALRRCDEPPSSPRGDADLPAHDADARSGDEGYLAPDISAAAKPWQAATVAFEYVAPVQQGVLEVPRFVLRDAGEYILVVSVDADWFAEEYRRRPCPQRHVLPMCSSPVLHVAPSRPYEIRFVTPPPLTIEPGVPITGEGRVPEGVTRSGDPDLGGGLCVELRDQYENLCANAAGSFEAVIQTVECCDQVGRAAAAGRGGGTASAPCRDGRALLEGLVVPPEEADLGPMRVRVRFDAAERSATSPGGHRPVTATSREFTAVAPPARLELPVPSINALRAGGPFELRVNPIRLDGEPLNGPMQWAAVELYSKPDNLHGTTIAVPGSDGCAHFPAVALRRQEHTEIRARLVPAAAREAAERLCGSPTNRSEKKEEKKEALSITPNRNTKPDGNPIIWSPGAVDVLFEGLGYSPAAGDVVWVSLDKAREERAARIWLPGAEPQDRTAALSVAARLVCTGGQLAIRGLFVDAEEGDYQLKVECGPPGGAGRGCSAAQRVQVQESQEPRPQCGPLDEPVPVALAPHGAIAAALRVTQQPTLSDGTAAAVRGLRVDVVDTTGEPVRREGLRLEARIEGPPGRFRRQPLPIAADPEQCRRDTGPSGTAEFNIDLRAAGTEFVLAVACLDHPGLLPCRTSPLRPGGGGTAPMQESSVTVTVPPVTYTASAAVQLPVLVCVPETAWPRTSAGLPPAALDCSVELRRWAADLGHWELPERDATSALSATGRLNPNQPTVAFEPVRHLSPGQQRAAFLCSKVKVKRAGTYIVAAVVDGFRPAWSAPFCIAPGSLENVRCLVTGDWAEPAAAGCGPTGSPAMGPVSPCASPSGRAQRDLGDPIQLLSGEDEGFKVVCEFVDKCNNPVEQEGALVAVRLLRLSSSDAPQVTRLPGWTEPPEKLPLCARWEWLLPKPPQGEWKVKLEVELSNGVMLKPAQSPSVVVEPGLPAALRLFTPANFAEFGWCEPIEIELMDAPDSVPAPVGASCVYKHNPYARPCPAPELGGATSPTEAAAGYEVDVYVQSMRQPPGSGWRCGQGLLLPGTSSCTVQLVQPSAGGPSQRAEHLRLDPGDYLLAAEATVGRYRVRGTTRTFQVIAANSSPVFDHRGEVTAVTLRAGRVAMTLAARELAAHALQVICSRAHDIYERHSQDPSRNVDPRAAAAKLLGPDAGSDPDVPSYIRMLLDRGYRYALFAAHGTAPGALVLHQSQPQPAKGRQALEGEARGTWMCVPCPPPELEPTPWCISSAVLPRPKPNSLGSAATAPKPFAGDHPRPGVHVPEPEDWRYPWDNPWCPRGELYIKWEFKAAEPDQYVDAGAGAAGLAAWDGANTGNSEPARPKPSCGAPALSRKERQGPRSYPTLQVTVHKVTDLPEPRSPDETRDVLCRVLMGGECIETPVVTFGARAADFGYCSFRFVLRAVHQVVKVQVMAKKRARQGRQFLGEALINTNKSAAGEPREYPLLARPSGPRGKEDMSYLKRHGRQGKMFGRVTVSWTHHAGEEPSAWEQPPMTHKVPRPAGMRQPKSGLLSIGRIGRPSDESVITQLDHDETRMLYKQVYAFRKHRPQPSKPFPRPTDTQRVFLQKLMAHLQVEGVLVNLPQTPDGQQMSQLYDRSSFFASHGLPPAEMVLCCQHCSELFCELPHDCAKIPSDIRQSQLRPHLRVWCIEMIPQEGGRLPQFIALMAP